MQPLVNTERGPKWRLVMWAAIASLLLAPLVAMQFTREMAWDGADFAFAALLLIGAGLVFEVAAQLTQSRRALAMVGACVAGLVLLVWADAAVGVF